jgi:hypothetical protein
MNKFSAKNFILFSLEIRLYGVDHPLAYKKILLVAKIVAIVQNKSNSGIFYFNYWSILNQDDCNRAVYYLDKFLVQ